MTPDEEARTTQHPPCCIYCSTEEEPLTDWSPKQNGLRFVCGRKDCEQKAANEAASEEAQKIDDAYEAAMEQRHNLRKDGG